MEIKAQFCLPDDAPIVIEKGDDLDLSEHQKKFHIPQNTNFIFLKYFT